MLKFNYKKTICYRIRSNTTQCRARYSRRRQRRRLKQEPPTAPPAPRPRNCMAYVALSRGAYDAQIFTKDREKLGAALGHDVSHSSAHAPEMKPEQMQEQAVTPQREIAPKQEQNLDIGMVL